ncbi:hypothetical protein ABVK25_011889 [Lepraria finkii]|uniref:Ubiquitin-like protease family profile domain-containing protein n=1 Tax=Lepraria finkii TaxID=1340010 RepID=A0ABR4AMQ4_9LECA
MTAKPPYLRLSPKLKELIDEIADRVIRAPIQILNQFYKAQGLLEDELPGTELEDLFEPDVRQCIITWINMDKRVSTQLQKLQNSPWALGKDGICEQFGEAMSRSIRFLTALAQLSELTSFETARGLLEEARKTRKSRGSYELRRGCATGPPWQPKDVIAAIQALKPQGKVEKRKKDHTATNGEQIKRPRVATSGTGTSGEHLLKRPALHQETQTASDTAASDPSGCEVRDSPGRREDEQQLGDAPSEVAFHDVTEALVGDKHPSSRRRRILRRELDDIAPTERRWTRIITGSGDITASSEQRLLTPFSQTDRQSDEPGFSSATRSPDVEQGRTRKLSLSRRASTQVSLDSSSELGAFHSHDIEQKRTGELLLSREHDDTVIVQASVDESLHSSSGSSASHSADMKHGRPIEVREVLSSREFANAFTQASTDKTLDSGLTFQLSDDPVAYDPAVYSGSSLNMSSLQVIPGVVGIEEQLVTSSEIVARDALSNLPDTDRNGALKSLSPKAWVSATALELILNCIKPEHCRVLSSGFVPQEANKLSEKKLLRLKDETKLWLPLNHRDHWTLAVIDLYKTTITVYDSSPTSHYEQEIDSVIQALTSYLNQHEKLQGSTWKTDQQRQHQQANSDDCGIFVLIFALADATGSPVPSQIHSLQWRQIFRYFIDSNEHVISSSATMEFGSLLEAKSRRMDTIHSEFASLCKSLSHARYSSKSAQGCVDLIVKGSLLAVPYRSCLRDKLALEQEQKQSEAAAYQSLVDNLTNSGISIDRELVEKAICGGSEKAHARLAPSESNLKVLKEAIESWKVAERACKAMHESAAKDENHAIGLLRDHLKIVEGIADSLHCLMEIGRQTLGGAS